MVPQHELRIGNWVIDEKSGTFFQIGKGIDIDDHLKSFLPISITPEVLKKYGFAFHDYLRYGRRIKFFLKPALIWN